MDGQVKNIGDMKHQLSVVSSGAERLFDDMDYIWEETEVLVEVTILRTKLTRIQDFLVDRIGEEKRAGEGR